MLKKVEGYDIIQWWKSLLSFIMMYKTVRLYKKYNKIDWRKICLRLRKLAF